MYVTVSHKKYAEILTGGEFYYIQIMPQFKNINWKEIHQKINILLMFGGAFEQQYRSFTFPVFSKFSIINVTFIM